VKNDRWKNSASEKENEKKKKERGVFQNGVTANKGSLIDFSHTWEELVPRVGKACLTCGTNPKREE